MMFKNQGFLLIHSVSFFLVCVCVFLGPITTASYIPADMRVQKWLWTAGWCWGSAFVTSLWHGRCSSQKNSFASSVMWSSPPSTSPQTPLHHLRYILLSLCSFFFWEHLFTTLLFPGDPPGPSHQTQSYVCRISRPQLRQGEIWVSLSHCCKNK